MNSLLEKKNIKSVCNHNRICSGFIGYNGYCTGFKGNCNGLWSLLVNVLPYTGGLLKPLNYINIKELT